MGNPVELAEDRKRADDSDVHFLNRHVDIQHGQLDEVGCYPIIHHRSPLPKAAPMLMSRFVH